MCALQKPAESSPISLGSGVVGVALAGGRSRRMGRDKTALAPSFLGGRTFLQWTLERLSAVCESCLVADRGRGLSEHSVPDGAGKGPVAGLLGAADHSPGHSLLVLACDLPMVPVSALSLLLALVGPSGVPADCYDLVVPISEQGPEPLCSFYGPRALEMLKSRVDQGQFSLRGLGREASELRCLQVPIARLWPADAPSGLDPELMFVNMNRPHDVQKLELSTASFDARGRFLRLGSTKR